MLIDLTQHAHDILVRKHHRPHCQMFQEGADLRAAHAGGMPDPVEANEVAYPVAVGLFGTRAVTFHPQGGPDPVHQLRRFAVRIHTPVLPMHGCSYSIIDAGKTRKRANFV